MDAPKIDLGNIAGSWLKSVVTGENAGDAAKNLLQKEGERVCFEGAVQRMHNNRWPIYIGTGVFVTGLLVLGAFITERYK